MMENRSLDSLLPTISTSASAQFGVGDDRWLADRLLANLAVHQNGASVRLGFQADLTAHQLDQLL
ncbi:MAG: hypothetical protein U0231_15580 [Nitrospiraceae bacterium]